MTHKQLAAKTFDGMDCGGLSVAGLCVARVWSTCPPPRRPARHAVVTKSRCRAVSSPPHLPPDTPPSLPPRDGSPPRLLSLRAASQLGYKVPLRLLREAPDTSTVPPSLLPVYHLSAAALLVRSPPSSSPSPVRSSPPPHPFSPPPPSSTPLDPLPIAATCGRPPFARCGGRRSRRPPLVQPG